MKMSLPGRHLSAVLALAAIAGCSQVPHEHNGANEPAKLAVSKPADPPADPSLTHRYSFTDGAKDSAGSVHGVLKNSAKVEGGKLVLANAGRLSSDAALGYLEFPSSLLPSTGSVSIVFWYSGTSAENFSRLIDIGDREGVEGRAFLYFTPRTAGGQSRARITAVDTRTSQTYVEGPAIDDGKPHCVAIVIDGNRMHLYIDGKEPAAAIDLGTNNLAAVRPVHSWIGRSGYDADPGLTGSLDELRIYNRPLSLPEVAAIEKAGADLLPPR
jgi:hypothetical protein